MQFKNNFFQVLFLFVGMSIFSDSDATTAPLPAQLLFTTYEAPSPLKADNKYFLVYEIFLTNFMKAPATITSFQIEQDHKKHAIALDQLKKSIQARTDETDVLNFAPGETKTIFIWLPFNNASEIPQNLTHHITINSSFRDKKYSFAMGPASLNVNQTTPVIIDAPLQGKNWLAGNAPSNTSNHRRTSMIIDGKPYYAQRYAIDFVQMGADGKSYTGDVHNNKSYHCYNQDVLAVADGTVVKTQNGIPENIPNSNQYATPIAEKTLPGNYIVLDLGNGHYAGYAHLIPGSLKVKEGDHVKAHQVIAKLGNSGNSSEPHLHFQIIDTGSFLKSNGVPYGFKHFSAHASELLEDETGSLKIKVSKAPFKEFSDQLVLENALINFD